MSLQQTGNCLLSPADAWRQENSRQNDTDKCNSYILPQLCYIDCRNQKPSIGNWIYICDSNWFPVKTQQSFFTESYHPFTTPATIPSIIYRVHRLEICKSYRQCHPGTVCKKDCYSIDSTFLINFCNIKGDSFVVSLCTFPYLLFNTLLHFCSI